MEAHVSLECTYYGLLSHGLHILHLRWRLPCAQYVLVEITLCTLLLVEIIPVHTTFGGLPCAHFFWWRLSCAYYFWWSLPCAQYFWWRLPCAHYFWWRLSLCILLLVEIIPVHNTFWWRLPCAHYFYVA